MPATERQIAANRANAQKSTGPTTDGGKAASRRNALRHGLAARVLAVAGEDQAAIDDEQKAWVEEIAPKGLVAARLAERAYRSFVRLQRCDRSDDQALAARVRRAEGDWHIRRQEELQAAIVGLDSAPLVASARLRSTAEGCRWMVSAWERLANRASTHAWNRDDHDRALQLLGIEGADHDGLRDWFTVVDDYAALREHVSKQYIDPDLSREELVKKFKPEALDDYLQLRSELPMPTTRSPTSSPTRSTG